jgi:hypothetical protein
MGGLEGAKELKSNPRHGGKSSTVSKARSLFKTYLTLQTRRRPDGAACKILKPKGTTSPDVSECRKKTLHHYISALPPGYESKESYAQSFGLQSHWELISTRLASRIENGKTQPPHWRRKTQPPHWRRKTQPSHWRRKTQPPHWRRETQPPYWRRKTTQRSLGMICGNTNCQDVSVLESNKILKE